MRSLDRQIFEERAAILLQLLDDLLIPLCQLRRLVKHILEVAHSAIAWNCFRWIDCLRLVKGMHARVAHILDDFCQEDLQLRSLVITEPLDFFYGQSYV